MKGGNLEASFGEMRIEGEDGGDFAHLHDFEAEAIREAYGAIALDVQPLQGSPMPGLVHPDYIQQRHELAADPTRPPCRRGVAAG